MSASQMALRGHIAQLEQYNIELRIALARTTKMVCKHCHKEISEVLTSYPPKCPLCLGLDPLGDSPPLNRICEDGYVRAREDDRPADVVPLIIVPGR